MICPHCGETIKYLKTFDDPKVMIEALPFRRRRYLVSLALAAGYPNFVTKDTLGRETYDPRDLAKMKTSADRLAQFLVADLKKVLATVRFNWTISRKGDSYKLRKLD